MLISKGNTYKDVSITLDINQNHHITVDRDIKAGNNMNKPFNELLAEIPSCK
jgi:hypothetical protein